jgi:hypothetical protein
VELLRVVNVAKLSAIAGRLVLRRDRQTASAINCRSIHRQAKRGGNAFSSGCANSPRLKIRIRILARSTDNLEVPISDRVDLVCRNDGYHVEILSLWAQNHARQLLEPRRISATPDWAVSNGRRKLPG